MAFETFWYKHGVPTELALVAVYFFMIRKWEFMACILKNTCFLNTELCRNIQQLFFNNNFVSLDTKYSSKTFYYMNFNNNVNEKIFEKVWQILHSVCPDE